jgi:hypothetical protein
MAAVIPFIPLIVAGIGAGTAAGAAKIQSNAANRGIAAQQDATNKSLAMNQRMFGQAQSLMQPYVSLGAQASGRGMPAPVNTLGNMGMPRSVAPTNTFALNAPAQQPGMVPLATMSPSSYGAASAMVKMQAPTGQIADVPSDRVAYYQSQGARLVS